MSTLSLYNASVKSLNGWMNNLEHILRKGQTHADEMGWSHEALLNARLAPDMFALIGQVQTATALVKACPHRLAGQTPPNWDDTETSFEDLYARIDRARTELAKFGPDAINGREAETFTVNFGPVEREFTGISYASGFILPNVFFHITTAYNILRHNGVPLGKFDFFGQGSL